MGVRSWGPVHDRLAEFELFTHFEALPGWLVAHNDGATGTNTLDDARSGTYSIVTAGADNDYHGLNSASEAFLIEAGKPLRAGCRLKLTEANTDDANIIFGLTDTLTTGGLLVDGGGPLASYDGAVFFKVDGGTVWQAETSNAGSQVTSSSVGTFTSGAWHTLEIEVLTSSPNDTIATVRFLLDGVQVAEHALTIAGLQEMHLVVGVKAGGANAETLTVDWIGARQAA